jgi:4-hydroxymandelate synthase
MTRLRMQPFADLSVDHVTIYVNDIGASAEWLVNGYGMAVYATADPGEGTATARSVGVGGNQIRLVLTEPLRGDHPSADYLDKHGDGVADIALRVTDAAAAFDEAVRRGARPVSPPAGHDGVVIATIMGFGDVRHSFVQRPDGASEQALPGLRPVAGGASPDAEIGLYEMDHFAVCVEAGQLDATIEFYEQVLDLEMIFTERIIVGSQAMDSKVVQNRSGSVTLTILEPDTSQSPGQIDEYLRNNNGAGIQHVAFATNDIVRAVGVMTANGVEFLATPDTYYSMLTERLDLARHSVEDLRRLNLLADEDQDGQLFQIFAKSVHPRNTFFLEIIERVGARTFGSGNIKALYEAVELQRHRKEARA